MKKVFGFLLMGESFEPEIHQARFETPTQVSYIFTVTNFEEAMERVDYLLNQNVGVIELCGAFGEQWANNIINHCKGKVGVGYVVHKPEQNLLFSNFFTDY